MYSHAIPFAQTNFREQIASKRDQSRKKIIYALICVIILFSVLYIIQINSITTGGYKIGEYKSEISKLQSENAELELKLSEIQSLGALEEKVKNLKMVKTINVEYISPTSEVAAK